MTEQPTENPIVKKLIEKSLVKYQVYDHTIKVFSDFIKAGKKLTDETRKQLQKLNTSIPVEFRERGEFQYEMRFAGDLLIVSMHTNVFEFNRDHEIMKTSYVKEDILRSYCGVILIHNFLNDSFRYNRVNDLGYLVARVFINKDMHYYVEGKRQVGFLYNNFGSQKMDKNAVKKILESAVLYCLDFDLLTPPYDAIKEVSVAEMLEASAVLKLKTGKRLGFRFQSDQDEITGPKNFL